MQLSLHKKSTTEATVKIQIEEADYQSDVKRKLKEYSQKAHVKGFRPGHVPPALIKKMYGRSILIDAVNALLGQRLPQYLQEQAITTVAAPLPVAETMESIDWEHQRDFELEYHIGMVPPFSCTLSKDIKVTQYQIKAITPAIVDKHIEELRKKHSKVEAVAQSEAQDTVYGLWHHSESGLEDQFGISIAHLDEAVRPSLIGLRPGDKATIAAKELLAERVDTSRIMASLREAMHSAGGTVTLTVAQIYRTQPATLDQAFFGQVFKGQSFDSAEDFRKEIEAALADQYQEWAQMLLQRTIQQTLVDHAAIALPEDFLQKWLHSEHPHLSEAALEEEHKKQLKALRWTLLTSKLAEEHHIQVQPEEVAAVFQQRIEELFKHNPEPLSEDVKAQAVQRFLRDKEQVTQISEELQLEQLFKVVQDHITLTPQEVSIEEFERIVRAL